MASWRAFLGCLMLFPTLCVTPHNFHSAGYSYDLAIRSITHYIKVQAVFGKNNHERRYEKLAKPWVPASTVVGFLVKMLSDLRPDINYLGSRKNLFQMTTTINWRETGLTQDLYKSGENIHPLEHTRAYIWSHKYFTLPYHQTQLSHLLSTKTAKYRMQGSWILAETLYYPPIVLSPIWKIQRSFTRG